MVDIVYNSGQIWIETLQSCTTGPSCHFSLWNQGGRKVFSKALKLSFQILLRWIHSM